MTDATDPRDHERDGESPEYSVEIDDLVVRFDGDGTADDGGGTNDGDESGVTAVDGVSLSVREGEFLVLVGPSGCGKTTTLRSVAGLETPTEGAIRIDGADVTGRDPRERDVSMVFQNYALYPHKTVRGNLAFPLAVRKVPDETIEKRVAATARSLGIEELLDRKPGQLSGGQQQRVALGRAIVREPTVFLMDEPLSNLDAKLRVRTRREIAALHRRVGKTTVYVTHDQAEAMTLGDRIAVMRGGRVQQVGPPEHLYAEPANRFVAGFLGDPATNFRDGILLTDPARVETDRFTVDLADERAARLADRLDDSAGGSESRPSDSGSRPSDVTLGVRPEDLRVRAIGDSDDGDDEGPAVAARPIVVEPLGSETVVSLVFEDGNGREEFEPVADPGSDPGDLTAVVDPDRAPSVGERVTVSIPPDSVHVFDRRTGENLTSAPDPER